MRKTGSNVNSDQLTKTTAEKVFGWKDVHKQDGNLVGKKQDKAGRWRKAECPITLVTSDRRMRLTSV